MRVELLIGALVLDGVELDAAGRAALVEALREGLAERGAAWRGGVLERLSAPPVAMGRAQGGAALGRALGGSLGAAIGRGGRGA